MVPSMNDAGNARKLCGLCGLGELCANPEHLGPEKCLPQHLSLPTPHLRNPSQRLETPRLRARDRFQLRAWHQESTIELELVCSLVTNHAQALHSLLECIVRW